MITKRQVKHLVRSICQAYERGDADDTLEFLLEASLLQMEIDALHARHEKVKQTFGALF